MPVELPLSSEAPVDEFTAVLDAVLYRFRALWNSRAERWTLEIQDAGGTALLSSAPVLADAPLFEEARAELPPGRFLVVDTEGDGTPPGRDELGGRVVVLYYPEAEVSSGVEIIE